MEEKMIPEIRKASLFDIPYLCDICLKTGFSGKDAGGLYSDPYMLAQFYAVPYAAYSTGHCFIVEAEIDGIIRPAGYILGVENSMEFNGWLEEEWMPQLRKAYKRSGSFKSESEKAFIELIQNKIATDEEIAAKYSAHFHMNVLPALNGMGFEKKLTEAFWESLKKKGVAGVHMGFAADKAGACELYSEMGYTEIKRTPWGLYMGYLF
jgi:ribosomal protein S18 acetylase RimI-like enzyme